MREVTFFLLESYESNRRRPGFFKNKKKLLTTYLGALIFSNVKITSGAFPLGVCAFPSRITVSPLKTLLTRATPLDGRIIGGRETGGTVAIFIFTVLSYLIFIYVVQVRVENSLDCYLCYDVTRYTR
jgi:hypothetical protein